jgi:hypothetical protein
MIKRVVVFFLMILAVSAVLNLQGLRAEAYQFEANGYYYNESADSSDGYSFGLDVTAYFQQVSVDGRPYMEAAFLQKTGYVTLGGEMGSYEIDETDGKTTIDPMVAGIEAGYVFSPVPVLIKAGYKYDAWDGEFKEPGDTIDFEITKNTYTGQLGYYITDGIALAGTIDMANEETKTKGSFGSTTKTDTMSYGANCKYVTMINADMGINLEASYNYVTVEEKDVKDLVNNVYQIRGDVYVTPMIGIGGIVAINTGDNKEDAGNTYTAEASVFFTPNVALMGSYSFFAADEKGVEDINSFEVAVKGRF